MTGTIKTIVEGKPFGFIAVEGMEKDLFFHKDALVGVAFEDLKVGDVLSFEVEEKDVNGQMKTNAANVQRA